MGNKEKDKELEAIYRRKSRSFIYKKLNKNERMLICDNCVEADTCKYAYTDYFGKVICHEVANDVIAELYLEDGE